MQIVYKKKFNHMLNKKRNSNKIILKYFTYENNVLQNRMYKNQFFSLTKICIFNLRIKYSKYICSVIDYQ